MAGACTVATRLLPPLTLASPATDTLDAWGCGFRQSGVRGLHA